MTLEICKCWIDKYSGKIQITNPWNSKAKIKLEWQYTQKEKKKNRAEDKSQIDLLLSFSFSRALFSLSSQRAMIRACFGPYHFGYNKKVNEIRKWGQQ